MVVNYYIIILFLCSQISLDGVYIYCSRADKGHSPIAAVSLSL